MLKYLYFLYFYFRWKNWKRRWFVLNDRCLYYFQYSAENVPKGIVPLENVKVLLKILNTVTWSRPPSKTYCVISKYPLVLSVVVKNPKITSFWHFLDKTDPTVKIWCALKYPSHFSTLTVRLLLQLDFKKHNSFLTNMSSKSCTLSRSYTKDRTLKIVN